VNRELYDNARWLIGAIAGGLAAHTGDGVSDVLARLEQQSLGESDFREPDARTLPALRHLPVCLGQTMLLDANLAAAIAAVEDALPWRLSPGYTDEILGEGFSANYCWVEIIGEGGFFPGDDFRLGLFLMGPDRHYPDHYHPAPELYWTLTPGSLWSRDSKAFVEMPKGATIWHPSMILHATDTKSDPLLAVWSWTRDIETHTKLA
jgi:hypothetical protein